MLISTVQQSDSVIHIYTFFLHSFPLWFIPGYWIQFLMLYNRTLLFSLLYVIICICLSLTAATPPSIPPPRQPQVCSLCLWVCFCYVLACPTLCVYPMNCSPPETSIHGISQARVLEWAAISFSRDLLHPGIELKSLASPALVGRFFTIEPPGKSFLLLRSVHLSNILDSTYKWHSYNTVFVFLFLTY